MTFKHIKFEDSPIMRSYEKMAIKKGLVSPVSLEAIVKKASAEKSAFEPSEDLYGDMLRLAKGLREKGFQKEAQELEDKVFITKQAETHLYHVFDESGEDLMGFAHPEGDNEICPAKDGLGKVETYPTLHEKILDVVLKTPTGKNASVKTAQDAPGEKILPAEDLRQEFISGPEFPKLVEYIEQLAKSKSLEYNRGDIEKSLKQSIMNLPNSDSYIGVLPVAVTSVAEEEMGRYLAGNPPNTSDNFLSGYLGAIMWGVPEYIKKQGGMWVNEIVRMAAEVLGIKKVAATIVESAYKNFAKIVMEYVQEYLGGTDWTILGPGASLQPKIKIYELCKSWFSKLFLLSDQYNTSFLDLIKEINTSFEALKPKLTIAMEKAKVTNGDILNTVLILLNNMFLGTYSQFVQKKSEKEVHQEDEQNVVVVKNIYSILNNITNKIETSANRISQDAKNVLFRDNGLYVTYTKIKEYIKALLLKDDPKVISLPAIQKIMVSYSPDLSNSTLKEMQNRFAYEYKRVNNYINKNRADKEAGLSGELIKQSTTDDEVLGGKEGDEEGGEEEGGDDFYGDEPTKDKPATVKSTPKGTGAKPAKPSGSAKMHKVDEVVTMQTAMRELADALPKEYDSFKPAIVSTGGAKYPSPGGYADGFWGPNTARGLKAIEAIRIKSDLGGEINSHEPGGILNNVTLAKTEAEKNTATIEAMTLHFGGKPGSRRDKKDERLYDSLPEQIANNTVNSSGSRKLNSSDMSSLSDFYSFLLNNGLINPQWDAASGENYLTHSNWMYIFGWFRNRIETKSKVNKNSAVMGDYRSAWTDVFNQYKAVATAVAKGNPSGDTKIPESVVRSAGGRGDDDYRGGHRGHGGPGGSGGGGGWQGHGGAAGGFSSGEGITQLVMAGRVPFTDRINLHDVWWSDPLKRTFVNYGMLSVADVERAALAPQTILTNFEGDNITSNVMLAESDLQAVHMRALQLTGVVPQKTVKWLPAGTPLESNGVRILGPQYYYEEPVPINPAAQPGQFGKAPGQFGNQPGQQYGVRIVPTLQIPQVNQEVRNQINRAGLALIVRQAFRNLQKEISTVKGQWSSAANSVEDDKLRDSLINKGNKLESDSRRWSAAAIAMTNSLGQLIGY